MLTASLAIHPLTPDRWDDLVGLFGPERGANSGCWCLWPFLRGRDWNAMSRDERRDGLRDRTETGPAPGLLVYDGSVAAGWVAVGPRAQYIRFQMAKTSMPLDTDPAEGPANPYAIPCFYIRSAYRKRGLMPVLARAAVDHATALGADAVDACPIDPDKPLTWGEGFVGIASVFGRLGFEEIARRSPKRPLMRLDLRPARRAGEGIRTG
ncbi:hypothetical protein [Polymorphum gilvum]|uniref:GCN5-related N-acetyltransferase n=1 Tax=Polymorphum gilvum (strain LMG 25793 / CGMCC 1.9160 / SL003B-26A1) TaxID=991905 RepID=F2IV06_POLGS|nr:hypothetical protein [Polymorphum gilvum]ADZ70235.1 GCN5-related N-acetyltransferase [Polymorphum gilvum SL003B-26A1]